NGFLSPAQFVPEGVVANKSKFLLTDVALGPRLALLRQKNATDEWREFFVVRWHQLQRRTRVGEPQRAGAAFVGTVRVDLGVHASVDNVPEDVGLEEVHRGVVVLVRFDD